MYVLENKEVINENHSYWKIPTTPSLQTLFIFDIIALVRKITTTIELSIVNEYTFQISSRKKLCDVISFRYLRSFYKWPKRPPRG